MRALTVYQGYRATFGVGRGVTSCLTALSWRHIARGPRAKLQTGKSRRSGDLALSPRGNFILPAMGGSLENRPLGWLRQRRRLSPSNLIITWGDVVSPLSRFLPPQYWLWTAGKRETPPVSEIYPRPSPEKKNRLTSFQDSLGRILTEVFKLEEGPQQNFVLTVFFLCPL